MNRTALAVEHAIAQLSHAIPDPQWWSGPAAQACAISIERLLHDLRALQLRLGNHWADGHH
ncbi:MAG: hypothetical protein KGL41_07030 [Actinomycetales bacterium]|nr:hypothetical protein [Actinomycetales bacterium]